MKLQLQTPTEANDEPTCKRRVDDDTQRRTTNDDGRRTTTDSRMITKDGTMTKEGRRRTAKDERRRSQNNDRRPTTTTERRKDFAVALCTRNSKLEELQSICQLAGCYFSCLLREIVSSPTFTPSYFLSNFFGVEVRLRSQHRRRAWRRVDPSQHLPLARSGTMHIAFTALPINTQTPYRVTAIKTWANKLLVGTSNGQLYAFRYSNSKDMFVVATSERIVFPSQRPILNIEVVEEWDIVIVLVGSNLYTCEMNNIGANQMEVAGSKGCGLFCCAPQDSKLFVVIKKRLCVYEWTERGFELDSSETHNLPDTPRLMQWCGGQNLLLGFKQEYDLLDLRSAKFSQVLKVKSGTEPVAAVELGAKHATIVLVQGQQGHVFLVNVKNGKVALGNRNGTSALSGAGRRGTSGSSVFGWSDVPTAVEFCGPFLVAALPRSIEIHNSSSRKITQSFSKQTGQLAVCRLKRDLASWSYVVVVAQPTSLIQLQVSTSSRDI